ncbi:hypothetical protein TRIUR3_26218 [Triticum urartu]|uniref:Uncharacterized protein n=1 Tax=Triticum urartu TaxID=4572 RepID=M7ZBQ0_TRIUA|nr:hypothetical protein TRIUR3_26218 [Triticum urartu]
MALEEGARVAAAAEARVAWLWRSMAGVRAASWSWSWSRGEARVAAAAELLCNIVPMNPLPHLASTGWALLFFFVGLTYALATSYVRDSACLYFERKDMEKRIFRVSQAHKLKVHQVQGKKSFPRHVAAAVKTRAALYASSIVAHRGCCRATGGGYSRPVPVIKTDTGKAAELHMRGTKGWPRYSIKLSDLSLRAIDRFCWFLPPCCLNQLPPQLYAMAGQMIVCKEGKMQTI